MPAQLRIARPVTDLIKAVAMLVGAQGTGSQCLLLGRAEAERMLLHVSLRSAVQQSSSRSGTQPNARAARQPDRGVAAAPMDDMPEQLSLPGLDAAAPSFKPDAIGTPRGKLSGYTLFLAIFPQPEDVQRIAQATADLRSHHGLGGTPLSPGRLHITLHAIAGFVDTIPQPVVDAAMAAATGVACPPLHIVFDHVLSFSDSNAFVLRCNASSDSAIARLRQSLAVALRRAGLHPAPSSTPHMTMLYDRTHIAEHPVEPIVWTATHFALVLSHVGIGHHQWIGQWALATRI